jgi:hypothetical protein
MFARRDGLKLALAAAAVAAGTSPGLVLPTRAEAGPVFKVPPLGYGFDALEPFGSKLTGKVNAAGLARFGSGWAWFIVDKYGKLDIISTPNQDTPLEKGVQRVVLGVDGWEHAYYLKFQHKRADYLAAGWNTVDWGRAAANFAKAPA